MCGQLRGVWQGAGSEGVDVQVEIPLLGPEETTVFCQLLPIISTGPTSEPSDHDADSLDAAQVQTPRIAARFATVGGPEVVPRYEDGGRGRVGTCLDMAI